ncbi:MAG TPA: 50S ribosomal protein L9 [Kaistella chaponensis]|uniref:Large ribosomal subunit protein bL9 n=1 Tax=Kaistella chaponensis TaxID=713588 RepID=A0A1N7MSZ4_9FLAO|nr:50S ribosomal protein L9 [Kaistella chaponensis]SIS89170.1 LSU ribosomal protein L9P [Kaistella chaponensis]HPW88243.1 50S ribosomal protein L9 [Kaistella chaponensis]HQC06744.1 50S ribosomal protein L9 [Kaistella chaponensis]
MDIILKTDVENLGLEFDTVNVKPGYARNYLLPKGLGLLATPKNKAALAETLEARKEEEAKLIAAANAIVEQLKKTNITIATKVGAGDKLFGSINNANLSEELSKSGVQVDKKYIKIPGNTIKRTGKVTAIIRLHRNVEHNFEFDIVSDAPPVVAAPKATPAPKKVEETPAEEA